jgi:hypothetical protein
MTPSIHDNLLISYEVRCEERIITLRTEFRPKQEFVDVIFKGVQGYRFENDAFGNIIFDVETIGVDQLLKEHGEEISESYSMGGAYGPWASNLETAPARLLEQGTQGFILSSSIGLSGWILAREISVVAVQRVASTDSVDAGTS